MITIHNVTDYEIQALVDNELDQKDREIVMAYIRRNSDATKKFEDLCHQKYLLQKWWQSNQI